MLSRKVTVGSTVALGQRWLVFKEKVTEQIKFLLSWWIKKISSPPNLPQAFGNTIKYSCVANTCWVCTII